MGVVAESYCCIGLYVYFTTRIQIITRIILRTLSHLVPDCQRVGIGIHASYGPKIFQMSYLHTKISV